MYQVDANFVERINEASNNIPDLAYTLPPFNDELEAEYNQRTALSDPRRFALMDRRLIPFGGGQSKVEMCDLFSSNQDFIHVKRYAGSSDLSHLFA